MKQARFEPELTNRIRKYKDAQFYCGSGIRWLLQDKDGNSVKCANCGNIANCVLYEEVERYELKIPLCKSHGSDFLKANRGIYEPIDLIIRKIEFKNN